MGEASLRIGPGRRGQGAELRSGMEHIGCREPMGLEKEQPSGWGRRASLFGIQWHLFMVPV